MALLRLIILGFALWFLYRTIIRLATEEVKKAVGDRPSPAGGTTVQMRKCAYCGLHVPEGESTQSSGQFFCGEAHRDAFLGRSQ